MSLIQLEGVWIIGRSSVGVKLPWSPESSQAADLEKSFPSLGLSFLFGKKGAKLGSKVRSIFLVLYSSEILISPDHVIFTTVQQGRYRYPQHLLFPVHRCGEWGAKETGHLTQSHASKKWSWWNKPGISDSRAHFFFPMMPLCLAGHKGPFLLHSLTTPKPKCSTVNLRNKEPWSQCLELSALAKYILVGGTFYLLFVVFKQRENLTRVPFPIRKTQQLEPLWNKKAGRF